MTATAAEEAAAMVAAVRDDPGGRRALASRFYDRCIGRKSLRSYRRAEMAFMRWQIRRGVLAAPDADPPGSRWWRAVNERLLLDACEADRLFRGGLGEPTRTSVASWLSFLHRPSGKSWYRADNASIVAGYVAHRHLAHEEHPLERFFMDVALVRVLFAECLLSAPRVALGRFGRGGPTARRSSVARRRLLPVAPQHLARPVSARRVDRAPDPRTTRTTSGASSTTPSSFLA